MSTWPRTELSLYTSQLGSGTFNVFSPPGEPVAVNLYMDANSFVSRNLGAPVTVFGTAKADTIVAGQASVRAGNGNDTVSLINYYTPALLDGGAGVDTFRAEEGRQGSYDLAAADQDLSGTVMRGFENLDLSSGSYSVASGSKAANRITGSNAPDTIDGRGGNDVLDGWGGSDVLTGGAGRDRFVFSVADPYATDRITDFSAKDDRLAFDRDVFSISGGAFDTRVVGKGGAIDLRGVDLYIYTGPAIDDYTDVPAILAAAQRDANGVFLVVENANDVTMLLYSAQGTQYQTLATFDGAIDPLDIKLSNMILV